MADNRSDQQKAKDAEMTLKNLKRIRQPFEEMIDNILKYVNHSRRLITDQESSKGQKTGIEVYDGTALSALNILTKGLCGYSVSRSFRWFTYTLPGKLNFSRTSAMRGQSGKRMDDVPEVKVWLEECEDVIYAAFLRSNLYDVMPEIVKDAASVGTVTAYLEEDVDKGRIIFTVPHFRECYIAEDRFGQVDTNYRETKYSLRQMLDKWGLEALKEADANFLNRLEKNPYDEETVIHAIYPRSDHDRSRLGGKYMPWASLWTLKKGSKLLQESGYESKPAITWRWFKNSDEWYGRSPAWDAYVDIALSQQQGQTNLIAAHKSVEPPMVGPESLRNAVVNAPGGWSWMEDSLYGKNVFPKPLNEIRNLPFSVEMQARTENMIKQHFHVDFFLMLSQAAMNKVAITATQVVEMMGEKAAILSVEIGRMETEAVNPIHDRVFDIEMRAGRIPPPPQILLDVSDGHIEVDYLGPLAQAQKRLYKTQAISAGVAKLAEISAVFPEVLDIPDPVELGKEILDSYGFPAKCMRTEDEIEEIRAQRAEKQAIAEQIQAGTEIAKALPGAGKAIEPNSPLGMIAGMGAQPGGTA